MSEKIIPEKLYSLEYIIANGEEHIRQTREGCDAGQKIAQDCILAVLEVLKKNTDPATVVLGGLNAHLRHTFVDLGQNIIWLIDYLEKLKEDPIKDGEVTTVARN